MFAVAISGMQVGRSAYCGDVTGIGMVISD